MNKNRLKGILFVLGASLCYGVMPAMTQLSYKSGLSLETMLCDRYIVSTGIIWIYILQSKADFRVNKKQFLFLMTMGIAYIGVAVFINMSYIYLPGAMTTIIVFLYVSIVVLLEVMIGREKPQAIKLFCVAFSLAGLVLVVWDPSGTGSLSLTGILLALAAGICYAIYAISIGGKLTRDLDSVVVIGYVMLIPTILYVFWCWIAGEPTLPATIGQSLYIVFLAVVCTFLAAVCFCKSVQLIGSGDAALINTVEPVIAYFSGLLLMGDVLNPMAILGGLIIITAIFIMNIAGGNKEKVHLER